MPTKKCCNPFNNHGKVTTDLRHPTTNEIVFLHPKLLQNINETSFLCRQCRDKIVRDKPSSSNPLLNDSQERIESSPANTTASSATVFTPASDEFTKTEHKTDQIIYLATYFGLDVPDKKDINIISPKFNFAATEGLYVSMVNKIKALFPVAVTKSSEDYEEVIEKLRMTFENTDSFPKKVEVLKLLPESWSYEKILSKFEGSTKHMIRSIKVEKSVFDYGVVPLKGRQPLEPELKQKVSQFYFEDEVSRPFPGRKDFISVKHKNGERKNEQKRLLLQPLHLLHERFLGQCLQNQKISLSTFTSLRPKQCVFAKDPSAANICVCMIHENTDMMIQGLKETSNFPKMTKQELLEKLIDKMLCPIPEIACYLQQCSDCDETNLINFIGTILDSNNIMEVKFSLWTTSPKCEITYVTEEVDTFIDRMKNQLRRFIVHKFKVDKQFGFIKFVKNNLVPNKTFMIQLDFAENFTCIVQNSIQSHYFAAPTVTIHPFVVFYKTENSQVETLSIVAISEVKTHNSVTVHTFLKKLIAILKTKFPEIEKLHYLSDGSGEQYKNKFNIKNLCCHLEDFGVAAEWHFFPTAHGKGPCDGIGGCLKRMAREASLRNHPINSAKQFFDWATTEATKQFKKNWNFIYVSNEEFEETKMELVDRFSNLKVIPGTKSFHQFIPMNNNEVSVSDYSGSNQTLTFKLSDPPVVTQHPSRTSKRQKKQVKYIE